MKLEVGKVYEDASGDLVAMLEHPFEPTLIVGVRKKDNIAMTYHVDGFVIGDTFLVREHKPGQRG